MSIVFVNDWNGYGAGIFDTFDNALEDMAIMAVNRGVEGHAERLEEIEYMAKPLAEIGFAGSWLDRNLYAIFSADLDIEMFSIRSHDTSTRPGKISKSLLMMDEELASPAWIVQKALFDFGSDNFVDGSGIQDEIMSTLEEHVWKIRHESKSPEDALATVRGNGLPNFASAIHARLFDDGTSDAEAFLDNLPARAADLFAEIGAKAFPGATFASTSAAPAR